MSRPGEDDELRKRRIEKEDGRYLIYYTTDGDELLGLTETARDEPAAAPSEEEARRV